MAKERNPARRQTVTESVYAPGIRGRKTGIELPDTGVRDEYGMEPIDHIFSSPERDTPTRNELGNATIDEEVDMDIDSPDAGPEPADLLKKNSAKTRLPPPGGRPPPRTSFKSPPVRHRGIVSSSKKARNTFGTQQSSSPLMQSVKRKLTFSARTKLAPPTADGHHINGHDHQVDEEEDMEDESVLRPGRDDSAAMLDDSAENEDAVDDTDEPEEPVAPKLKGKRGRPQKTDPGHVPEPSLTRPKSRLKGKRAAEAEIEKPAKKQRSQLSSHQEEEPDPEDYVTSGPEPEMQLEPERQPAPKRKSRSKPQREENQGKGRGRAVKGQKRTTTHKQAEKETKSKSHRKISDAGEESVIIRQAPPMPKRAGLAILRRVEDNSLSTTRSGRHSYKPVEFWRGEKIVTERKTVVDPATKAKFVVEGVSEIVRVEHPSPPRKQKHIARRRGAPSRRRMREGSYEGPEDLPREEWETEAGTVMGEVVVWEHEHEQNPPVAGEPVSVTAEQLAIADSAIVTREIQDATFCFTKTLSMPFFGTGVVDLPPGGQKKMKNSRKMHMAFFVHSGLVKVNVHKTTFSIGAGGQWFVPRGNYYSILNNTDKDARLFFSQGCEVTVPVEEQE